jgi:amino acid adenylation domain-containing protein
MHLPTSSPQQERVWRLMQRHGPEAFRVQARLEVSGADEPAVRAALEALFAEEAVLRQRWEAHPSAAVPLVRELSAAQALRAAVSASDWGPNTGALTLDLPAYAVDEASLSLLASRLAHRLSGRGEGTAAPTPFALVAEWERSLAFDEEAAVGRGFWRERLAELRAVSNEAPRAAHLPADWRAARVEQPVQPALAEFLRGLDRGVPGAALLAAWRLVVARRLGVAAPLGVRLNGRGEEALTGVVGPMARVVPMPAPGRTDRPLASAAEAVRAALFDSQARQDCFTWRIDPDDVAPAWAAIGHARREGPVVVTVDAVAVTLRILSCVEDVFQFRLVEAGDQLILEYDSAGVSADDAQRMLDGLLAFLEAARVTPAAPVDDLPVLGPRELASWRATADPAALPPAPALLQRLLDTAEAFPDRVAVAAEARAVTYRQLAAWSSTLAEVLGRSGAQPERVVALALPPSPELAAALWGVMRTGAAFAPMDPAHPPERLAALVRQLRPVALVAEGQMDPLVAAALADVGAAAIAAGSLAPGAGRGSAGGRPSPAALAPQGLAYILFTSGSTGAPRAVGVPRRALDRQIDWFVRRFALGADARVLARTSPAFDAGLWEWLATLASGATVVAAPGAGLDRPLTSAVARGAVTHVQLVPSLLDLLARHEPEALQGVRTVFAGGEVLTAETAARAAAGGRTVVNLYGPTECCIQVSAWQGDPAGRRGALPVGAAASGSMLLVAASAVEPGARGAVGTLLIGGEGLARGYLGDPAASAAAFVPNPWSRAGERLYRSGDRACFDGDELIVLGREDDQVKIRGARVEPAEVAAALLSVPGVEACAVVVERDPGFGARLVAVYAASPDAAARLDADLPREASRRLPGFMVPARFVAVRQLPRLASGKPDLAQLRRLAGQRSDEAPVTPTEHLVADVWREVLGLARVGRHDGFFELGGHSILLLRALSRLRAALGREVPIRLFHEARDVAGLARLIDAEASALPLEDTNG